MRSVPVCQSVLLKLSMLPEGNELLCQGLLDKIEPHAIQRGIAMKVNALCPQHMSSQVVKIVLDPDPKSATTCRWTDQSGGRPLKLWRSVKVCNCSLQTWHSCAMVNLVSKNEAVHEALDTKAWSDHY